MTVGLSEWLKLVETEYLADFVRQGGSATRFVVVPDGPTAGQVLVESRRVAESSNYLVVTVDAAHTRIHLMHQLFHAVARQVPWDRLARTVVRRCYEESGMQVPQHDLRIDGVAAANGVAAGFLRGELRRNLEGLLNLKAELAKDFRYAMLWLCMDQIAHLQGNDAECLQQWLRGDLRLISSLKRLLIFRKIDRHNGRAMLSSLGAWCRLAGLAGLVLQLDIRQLAALRRTDIAPDTLHYSTPAVMDAYEVLRQIIDSTDDLPGIMTVVMVPPDLFDDDKRGVKVYKALYERVWPDVRLKARPNPLSALTTLASLQQEVLV